MFPEDCRQNQTQLEYIYLSLWSRGRMCNHHTEKIITKFNYCRFRTFCVHELFTLLNNGQKCKTKYCHFLKLCMLMYKCKCGPSTHCKKILGLTKLQFWRYHFLWCSIPGYFRVRFCYKFGTVKFCSLFAFPSLAQYITI